MTSNWQGAFKAVASRKSKTLVSAKNVAGVIIQVKQG